MWGTCSNCKYGRKEKYGICCSNVNYKIMGDENAITN